MKVKSDPSTTIALKGSLSSKAADHVAIITAIGNSVARCIAAMTGLVAVVVVGPSIMLQMKPPIATPHYQPIGAEPSLPIGNVLTFPTTPPLIVSCSARSPVLEDGPDRPAFGVPVYSNAPIRKEVGGVPAI